ncbi:unnamed protein product [Brassicogethes aeneus]|uniref:Ankyrin repeat domain-containing protein 39 n=1 Tax=Brassicogethes aeneus TaxID=1431903 RepID=A0A9P0FIR0_BRAAE|nr:unnamed protein product [Brassicogethes aeneus]
MNFKTHDTCDTGCCKQTPVASQTLDEMEFERGIWSAAMYGEIDKMQKCLDKNQVTVNTMDQYGFTALHYAARNGQLEACKFLVERGADFNAQTKELRATPLHRAVTVGITNILNIFKCLKHAAQQPGNENANLNGKGHQPVVEYLLTKGANVNLKDADGKLALDRAIESKREYIIKILKEKTHRSAVFATAANFRFCLSYPPFNIIEPYSCYLQVGALSVRCENLKWLLDPVCNKNRAKFRERSQ